MENSKIEWCDHTVNLWWGCAKVHAGCKNCYAEQLSDVRYKNDLWGEKTNRKRIKSAFKNLDKFQEYATKKNQLQKVFVGSMMDIFEDSKKLTNPIFLNYNPFGVNMTVKLETTHDLRQHLFERIENKEYENLVFLFLTKRPTNIINMIPSKWINNTPSNVWFGTSVSSMETWKYAESLKLVSNTNLFLSIEPQTGIIHNVDLSGINWVIQGCESGANKRRFDLNFAYDLKELCFQQDVPYFLKQIQKNGKVIKDIDLFPKELQSREYPKFNQ